MAVNVPSFLPSPFADEGQRATIPATPSSEQGRANYQQGFPQVCAQPLASGGIPPNYQDFQGIFYDLSSSIFYMQTGALWPWSSTLTYPLGAHVLGSNNNEYVAVQESTGQDPTKDSTGAMWKNVTTFLNTAFLPLAGGTMTGAINFGASNLGLQWTCANGDVYAFRAYSPESIMQLVCISGDVARPVVTFYPNGNIDIVSINGSQSTTLTLSPAGNLVWGGQKVLVNGDVFTQTAQTNSITLPAGGTWNWLACGVTTNGEYTSTVSGNSPGGAVVDLGSNITTTSIIAIQVG